MFWPIAPLVILVHQELSVSLFRVDSVTVHVHLAILLWLMDHVKMLMSVLCASQMVDLLVVWELSATTSQVGTNAAVPLATQVTPTPQAAPYPSSSAQVTVTAVTMNAVFSPASVYVLHHTS